MSVERLSKNYATAIFEVATENGVLKDCAQEMDWLLELSKNEEIFTNFFGSFEYDQKDKRAVLEDIISQAGLSNYVANFLRYLLQHERMEYLNEIAKYFHEIFFKSIGIEYAYVYSAIDLNQDQIAKIKQRLVSMLDDVKDVKIVNHKEPELIGGIKVRIGNRIFDGSIKSQLTSLRKNIIERA